MLQETWEQLEEWHLISTRTIFSLEDSMMDRYALLTLINQEGKNSDQESLLFRGSKK